MFIGKYEVIVPDGGYLLKFSLSFSVMFIFVYENRNMNLNSG
jgi:hypothetical protein